MARWLAAGHGGVSIGEEWIEPLCQLADASEWSMADVVTSHDQIETKRIVWEGILEEALAIIEAAGRARPSRISRARALSCVLTPTELTGAVTGSEATVTMAVTTAERTAALSPPAASKVGPKAASTTGAVHPDDAHPDTWTDDMLRDMKVQGASRLSQLTFLSVSMELGHKASMSEYTGASYNGSVEMAVGVKAAAKSKYTTTLSGLWRAAVESGDNTFLERHNDRTVTSLVRDSTDSFSMTAGSRVMQAWGKAKAMGRQDPRLTAMYWGLLWEENPCMGLREIVDMNLLKTARSSLFETDRAKGRTTPKAISLSSLGQQQASASDATSETQSVPGSIPSSAGVTCEAELMTMIRELRHEMNERADEEKKVRDALSKRVGDLNSELGKAKAAFSRTKDAHRDETCFECGKKGHIRADCPKLKKSGDKEE